jgi:hypothetical protein
MGIRALNIASMVLGLLFMVVSVRLLLHHQYEFFSRALFASCCPIRIERWPQSVKVVAILASHSQGALLVEFDYLIPEAYVCVLDTQRCDSFRRGSHTLPLTTF